MKLHAAEVEVFRRGDEVSKREDALPPTPDSLVGQMSRKLGVDKVHLHALPSAKLDARHSEHSAATSSAMQCAGQLEPRTWPFQQVHGHCCICIADLEYEDQQATIAWLQI